MTEANEIKKKEDFGTRIYELLGMIGKYAVEKEINIGVDENENLQLQDTKSGLVTDFNSSLFALRFGKAGEGVENE